jgi:peptidylprolyl isomerase
MQKSDFLKIEYVGRIKATGEIFDLTSEDLAKKEKVYNPNHRYGPALIIIGARMIIEGVERRLLKMKVGEEKEFELQPNEAFGMRNPGLIRILPLSKFIENKINPVPGTFVEIDGRQAKVQNVTGGRIRIDFNYPLAGKVLHYKIKIVEKIDKINDQIEEIVKYYTLQYSDIKVTEDKAVITLKRQEHPVAKKISSQMIIDNVKGIKKVDFVEPKPPKKEEKKAEPAVSTKV